MGVQRLRLTKFNGGLSDDDKFGPADSFSRGRAIDFRRSPGILQLAPQLVRETITATRQSQPDVALLEVNDAIRLPSGKVAIVAGRVGTVGGQVIIREPGSNGAAGTYKLLDSWSSAHMDIVYRPEFKKFFTINEEGGLYTYSENGASFGGYAISTTDTFYYESIRNQGGVATYSIPTALSVADADTLVFSATVDPLRRIAFVSVQDIAGATYTCVLRDGNNQTIATVTNFNPGGLTGTAGKMSLQFDFGGFNGLRLSIGATYKVSIYCSVAGRTINTLTAGQMNTAVYIVLGNYLANTGINGHRVINYGAKSYICNGRYLAEWEMLDFSRGLLYGSNLTGQVIAHPRKISGFVPHRLVFPGEVALNGVALYNEYLAMSGVIEDSIDTAGVRASRGVIFFWNFTDTFYSYAIEIPEGAPHGLFAANNALYWEAGGRMFRYAGGDIEVIYEFPGVDEFVATTGPAIDAMLSAPRHAFAKASASNKLLVGFPNGSANSAVEMGIYSYGQNKGTDPPAIGFDSIVSSGNITPGMDTTTTPATPYGGITMVKRFGNHMLVGWRDIISGTKTAGIDYLNETSWPAGYGEWSSLWFDNGTPDKEKSPYALKFVFKRPLPAGTKFTPRIRYDYGDWVAGETVEAGAIEAVMSLAGSSQHPRWYEVMIGGVFETVNSKSPQVRSATLKFDDNEEEDSDTEAGR